MAWSDKISMCDLSDEPSLSEDLTALINQSEGAVSAESPSSTLGHDQSDAEHGDDFDVESGSNTLDNEGSLDDEARSIDATSDEPVHIVLNMTDVTYINSSNIGQLIRLRKAQERISRQLMLCSVNDDVLEVLRVTGVERLFRIVPDPLTALTAIQISGTTHV